MWNKIKYVSLIQLGVIVGMGLTSWRSIPLSGQQSSYHAGPSIEQVQGLAALVTTKVEISDVQLTHIDGYTGGVTAALLVRGDLLIGTDLSRARFETVDSEHQNAVLTLIEPSVTSPRLDHDRTRLFAISQQGLWQITPTNVADAAVVNRAYADAQRLIADAGKDASLMQKSRTQAEQVVKTFFTAIGWTVSVHWVG